MSKQLSKTKTKLDGAEEKNQKLDVFTSASSVQLRDAQRKI